jgi:hypothetical protein
MVNMASASIEKNNTMIGSTMGTSTKIGNSNLNGGIIYRGRS